MIEKYYTPSIEEFHVGFEYYLQDLHDNLVDKTYRPCIVEDTDDLKTIEVNFFPHDTRVKHLDQEDIESLEFKRSNLDKAIFLKEMKEFQGRPCESVGIMFNEGRNHILIFYVPDGSTIPAGINLFVGTIKNKSELKKVLKMLNIN